jgi:GNAT superfamily N-acetyltransferase
MTAALTRQRSGQRHGDGLQPTNLARDLYQIGGRLDANGRAAVREMKVISKLGPLLWLFSLFGLTSGLGPGYVWRAGKHVVGNVSLYRGGIHPYLGQGWLIANVVVHPNYRRQGIARAAMRASIDLVRSRGGRWIALQVEADNDGALTLYDSLGFGRFETLTQWETRSPSLSLPTPEGSADIWRIRSRRWTDADAEADLIYTRARQGAMAWTRPIERHQVRGGLGALGSQGQERWVLADLARPRRLLGSIWLEATGWQRARLTLFLDPALNDPQARCALLSRALHRPLLRGQTVRLETVADDEAVEESLRAAGFRPIRSLVQMRLDLTHRGGQATRHDETFDGRTRG